MVGPQLIDLVNVTLVLVVVHSDSRTMDDGLGVGFRDNSESVDPQMGAEEGDGLAVMPHQTAQLATLPCPHLTLRKMVFHMTEVRRHTASVGSTSTTGTDPHIE